jgi:hypothetical protein
LSLDFCAARYCWIGCAYIVGGFRGRHANQATTSSTPSGAKGQKLATMLTMS